MVGVSIDGVGHGQPLGSVTDMKRKESGTECFFIAYVLWFIEKKAWRMDIGSDNKLKRGGRSFQLVPY